MAVFVLGIVCIEMSRETLEEKGKKNQMSPVGIAVCLEKSPARVFK